MPVASALPPTDNFTCPSTFQPGSNSRSNDKVAVRQFLVLESDKLTKEEMLSAFNWCRRFMRLRAIVDTAGKSLHGWFDYPGDEVVEELRVVLTVIGFDPALLKPSQPARLPGTRRKDKEGLPWQRLIWLDASPTATELSYRLPSLAMHTKASTAFFTGQTIWHAKFPQQKWAVDGIIPVGLTLLCGRPKIGKSFLTLGLATSIASGDESLGVHVERQGVLMLALEDTARRIQKRMKQMRVNPPEGKLLIRTTTDGWPRMDAGGLVMLKNTLLEHPDIGVVVVDTLQKVKPVGRKSQNAYESDYDAISGLHALAAQHNVAIILVHHTRKSPSEDVFDEVSGSLGLTGVADTTIVIKKNRGESSAFMHLTGRDVEERELAIEFNETTGVWRIAGDAETFCASRDRQVIQDLLSQSHGAMSLKEIREALEYKHIHKSDGALRTMLSKMVSDGELSRPTKNQYAPPYRFQHSTSGNNGNSGNSGNSSNMVTTSPPLVTAPETVTIAVTTPPSTVASTYNDCYQVTEVSSESKSSESKPQQQTNCLCFLSHEDGEHQPSCRNFRQSRTEMPKTNKATES